MYQFEEVPDTPETISRRRPRRVAGEIDAAKASFEESRKVRLQREREDAMRDVMLEARKHHFEDECVEKVRITVPAVAPLPIGLSIVGKKPVFEASRRPMPGKPRNFHRNNRNRAA
ncbi:MAG: hypothetical protein H7039_12720 [Bryobacteraceae bacterium]|nr:hypothetical protein [Bryobacteraceae bacterium]